MHDKGDDPGNRHLQGKNRHGITPAQLGAHGTDGRHTGWIEQDEHQEHIRDRRREHARKRRGRRGTQQHSKRRDNALLGDEAAHERRRSAPVAKTERREHGSQKPAQAREHALRLVGHHVEANVERLQEPNHNRGRKDDGERLGDKALGLVPCEQQRGLGAGHAIVGKLHNEGHGLALKRCVIENHRNKHAYQDAQNVERNHSRNRCLREKCVCGELVSQSHIPNIRQGFPRKRENFHRFLFGVRRLLVHSFPLS